MPLAANTTGGHTASSLLGIAILVWLLAVAGGLLYWLIHAIRITIRRRRKPAAATTARATPAPAAAAAPTPTPQPTQRVSGPASTGVPAQPAGDATPPPPAIPGARLSPEQLEPLGVGLSTARRLEAVESLVAHTLCTLPSDRWYVARYFLTASQRIPFVIVGETGVFTVWALDGPPIWNELASYDETAARVKRRLPGYTGTVHVGICRAIAKHEIEPRWWCRPGEPGAWVMSLGWLIRWIEHFGPGHGLGVKDIERLRMLANPRRDTPPPRVPEVVPDLGSQMPSS